MYLETSTNNSKSIALAIITYYPRWYEGKLRNIRHTDKIRGDLAIQFLKKANLFGYIVIVADGKSSKAFKSTLSQISGLLLIKRSSLKRSTAKRQVIRRASRVPNIKIIIVTEPEKISLLDFINILTRPLLNKKADIVIPKRQDLFFKKTYPSYMYRSEVNGNKYLNKILRSEGILVAREDFDFFFGVRLFLNNKKIVNLFIRQYRLANLKNNFENHLTVQYFSIVLALKNNFRIQSVEIPFIYPRTQKDNEEKGAIKLFKNKRQFQQKIVLTGFRYFLTYVVADKKL